MVLKLAPSSSHKIGPGNPEGQEELDHVVDGDKGDVFEEGDGVEDGHAVTRPALLQIEEAKAVDDTYDSRVSLCKNWF